MNLPRSYGVVKWVVPQGEHDYLDIIDGANRQVIESRRMTKYRLFLCAGRFTEERLLRYRSDLRAAPDDDPMRQSGRGRMTTFKGAPMIWPAYVQKYRDPDARYQLAKRVNNGMVSRATFLDLVDALDLIQKLVASDRLESQLSFVQRYAQEVDQYSPEHQWLRDDIDAAHGRPIDGIGRYPDGLIWIADRVEMKRYDFRRREQGGE